MAGLTYTFWDPDLPTPSREFGNTILEKIRSVLEYLARDNAAPTILQVYLNWPARSLLEYLDAIQSLIHEANRRYQDVGSIDLGTLESISTSNGSRTITLVSRTPANPHLKSQLSTRSSNSDTTPKGSQTAEQSTSQPEDPSVSEARIKRLIRRRWTHFGRKLCYNCDSSEHTIQECTEYPRPYIGQIERPREPLCNVCRRVLDHPSPKIPKTTN